MLTPFQEDGGLDLPLFAAHAAWTLDNGADGITPFGTTGEGASIGFDERAQALAALVDAGIPADRMTVGICACALPDAVAQVKQALDFGVARFLLLPPFYFNGLGDGGLYDWHAALFAAADARAQFILYHIPQVTQVPLSLDLVLRLRRDFPDRVIAIKDSSGDWDNARSLLDSGAIPVLTGDERLLHRAAALGGAGSICGMANLAPARMRTLFERQQEDAALSADVSAIVSGPVVPAMKAALAAQTGNAAWTNLRAPLQPLDRAAGAAIAARFVRAGAA